MKILSVLIIATIFCIMSDLNFFHMTNEDVEKKVKHILNDIDLIKHPQKQRKLYCSRYLPSLEMIKSSKKSQLIEVLERYATIIK